MSDLANSRYEDLEYEAKKRPIEFMKEYDIDIPEPTDAEISSNIGNLRDEDEIREKLKNEDAEGMWLLIGAEPEVSYKDIEAAADASAEQQLKYPLDYLADIYGEEEAVKKAIEIAGIDVNAAAEEAVSTDGAAHFLAHYDGNFHTAPGGIVYWRTN